MPTTLPAPQSPQARILAAGLYALIRSGVCLQCGESEALPDYPVCRVCAPTVHVSLENRACVCTACERAHCAPAVHITQ